MRIGNLEDTEISTDKSAHYNELADLINSKKELSATEKWKNWWHYYKWYVVCGIILLGIACDLVGNALGIWEKSPDFQIAYVGRTALPQDTADALTKALSSLGTDLDFDGDGKINIRLNQYISEHPYADTDAVYYDTVTELTLIGDISDCESYFFLMDDPGRFQREYQVLALPDGSCPDNADNSAHDKAVLWSDCPALAEIADFVEAEAPGSRELLSGLYIGRRCFYNETQVKNAEKCSSFWDWIVQP